MSNIETPNDFENELRRALRRQEPALGFTDRVMARIPNRRPSPFGIRQWLAVAAAACIAVVGSGAWEQHRRQVEGEARQAGTDLRVDRGIGVAADDEAHLTRKKI